jgi:hypothetical protein
MHACALAPHAAARNGTAIFFQIALTDFSPGSLLLVRHPTAANVTGAGSGCRFDDPVSLSEVHSPH